MSRNKHILAKLPPPMSTPWLLDPVFGEVLCCRSVSVHNQPSLRSRTANSYPDSASANERLRVDLHLGHTPLLQPSEPVPFNRAYVNNRERVGRAFRWADSGAPVLRVLLGLPPRLPGFMRFGLVMRTA